MEVDSENEDVENEQPGNVNELEESEDDANSDDDFVLNNDDCPVHPFINCTVRDAINTIHAFSTRHNLSWTALSDLAVLVNTILGQDSLPTTKYLLRKKVADQYKFIPVVHMSCPNCKNYLGKKRNFGTEKHTVCQNCMITCSLDTKYKKSHFITMPAAAQIIPILEQNIKNDNFMGGPPETINGTDIKDVHDAECYRNLKAEMGNSNYITLTLSTDGAVVHKSTKEKSLWPLQLFINEINLENRFKRENIICSAFAYGQTPEMTVFMKELIEELNQVNRSGGIPVKNKQNQTMYFKMAVTCVTTDTVAKAYVAKKTPFNSHSGCPYCNHFGTIIPGSKSIKYCFNDNKPNRTHAESKESMMLSMITGKNENGYNGVSPLLALDTWFDIIWQIVIDKMHCIDLGVVKKIFDIWLNSSNRNEPYYIGNFLSELDKRLRELKLPRTVSRVLRPLSQRDYYKAYEWKYLLQFAAFPILDGILEERYNFNVHLIKHKIRMNQN